VLSICRLFFDPFIFAKSMFHYSLSGGCSEKDISKYRTKVSHFGLGFYCEYIAKLAVKCDETAVTKPLMAFVTKPLLKV